MNTIYPTGGAVICVACSYFRQNQWRAAFPFIIEEEKNGLMFQSANDRELSRQLERILFSPEFARGPGKNGREKAEKVFDYTKQRNSFFDFIEKLSY